MNEQKIHEEMPNGTAGEFQSDSKQALLNKTIIIKGILTSRLETRQKNNQPYYYGFFKLENQVGEFPVVFKTKPNLTKGNQAELKGNWANRNGSRPSFTCQAYQITADPPIIIKCFYNSKFSPCPFTTSESHLMEKHYKKEHRSQAREVIHG